MRVNRRPGQKKASSCSARHVQPPPPPPLSPPGPPPHLSESQHAQPTTALSLPTSCSDSPPCPPHALSRISMDNESSETSSSRISRSKGRLEEPCTSAQSERATVTAAVWGVKGRGSPRTFSSPNPEFSIRRNLNTCSGGGEDTGGGSQLLPDKTDSPCMNGDGSLESCSEEAVVGNARLGPATSVWDAGHKDRDTLAWDQHADCSLKSLDPASRSSLSSSDGGGGPRAGMSRFLSLRRCRQWLGVGLPLTAFLYVLLYCHSSVWSSSPSFSLQPHPLPSTLLAGSGFRKLLEEQEKARLSMTSFNAGLTQRLPSCVIVGVRKCGTRALLEFLELHPDVVTAEDEVHFFNDDRRYRLGLEWYRHLMPLSLPHQITMEKTPGYFISPMAPSRLRRMNSTVKLLVLLRHPTTRTVSDYTQIFHNKLAKNETLEDFEELAIDADGEVNTRYKAVQISMYHRHFRRWLDTFSAQQIHVVDGDRLITDPVSELHQIETFLGLPHFIDYSVLYFNSTRGFYCMRVNATYERCLGASKGRKHPQIRPSVIHKLNQFFQPHNKQLFQLLKREFPWS